MRICIEFSLYLMKFKYFIINLLSVIFLSLIITKYFGLFINKCFLNTTDVVLNDMRPTSVWCLGSDHKQRRCRFANLCYKKDTRDYLFLSDDNLSVKSGIPVNRFSPTLLDLSSVRDHNQFYFNYIEMSFNCFMNLTKTYKISTLRGKTFVMSRFKADNLMHYFHDDLIPLFFTLEEIGSQQMDSIFLDDIYSQDLHKPFDKTIFDSIFPKSIARTDLNDKTIYCFEESFVGLSKSMTWYDYGFRSPQSPLNRSEEESLLITKTIRKLSSLLIPFPKCATNYVIIILRQLNRKIVNFEELIEIISNFTDLSVLIIHDLNNNFEDIIAKVFCAKLLIGMHGSGLILSLFLRPGSSLIELFPFAINPNHLTPYKSLSQLNAMKIHYFYWRNRFINNTITHKEYPKELGGTTHLSAEEVYKIESLTEEVPKHLCCTDPYWLYRIYSDTIVDINSFQIILEKALQKSAEPLILTPQPIAPGLVSQLRCDSITINDKHFLQIFFQKPWNLDYIECLEIEIKYEVLIQEVHSVSAKSSLITTNEFTFTSETNKTYNIWIRCQLNGIYGPFNTNPLIC